MTHDRASNPRDVLHPLQERFPRVTALLARSPRAAQLVRDVAMLASGFFGDARAVSSQNQVGRAVPGATPAAEFDLEVIEVREETPDARTFVLKRPEGFSYQPGQFLTLMLDIEGKQVRRSYSFSSCPHDDGPLAITVKRVPEGLGSPFLHASISAGQSLRARGPSGSFVFEPSMAPEHLVLIGGGSGITPLMSILRTALRSCPSLSISLVFANRDEQSVIFRDELASLEATQPRLRVLHVLESPGSLIDARHGRIDRSILTEVLVGDARSTDDALVYLCGPEPMMQSVQEELVSLGLRDEQLKLERFAVAKRSVDGSERKHLQVLLGSYSFELNKGATILESANAAGVFMDSSCTMGGCGTCRVKLREGEVVMDEPNCLSREERAAGFILACVSRPLTDVVIEPGM